MSVGVLVGILEVGVTLGSFTVDSAESEALGLDLFMVESRLMGLLQSPAACAFKRVEWTDEVLRSSLADVRSALSLGRTAGNLSAPFGVLLIAERKGLLSRLFLPVENLSWGFSGNELAVISQGALVIRNRGSVIAVASSVDSLPGSDGKIFKTSITSSGRLLGLDFVDDGSQEIALDSVKYSSTSENNFRLWVS